MKQIVICIGIFLSLALSRFLPHPPNFTSLIALSFYVPLFLGISYIPVIIVSFAITDLIIGYHFGTFFTWGSVLLIGLISNLFKANLSLRIFGALSGALIFFLVTNLGVWISGMYGYTIQGLVECFLLAIPFFSYTIISTLIFSSIIEALNKFFDFSKISMSNLN